MLSAQVRGDSIPHDSIARSERLDDVLVTASQMLGGKFQARNRTGSAYYISPLEIQKMGYTDINRMLRAVPGVNMYEEDGFGLRPNISLRGTKAERSERISLMEDGILAAPAPYSSPAAYYFPNAARMQAVEVLKGSSQVQYGPFTTGGAINLVSASIPKSQRLKLEASMGSFKTGKAHIQIGNSWKHFGYVAEYLHYRSDGFKENKWHDDTGFVRRDLITKLRLNTAKSTGVNHSLELKFGLSDENSDETYLGLTEEDFALKPYQRYAGAQMDRMKTKHSQLALTYILSFSLTSKLTTQAYYNHFHRNWYKLNDVRTGYTSSEKKSIAEILREPDVNHSYMELLRGERDYIGEALILRANNRSYYSRGLQSKFEHLERFGSLYLNLEAGLRYHEDAEDRFQWDDSYSIQGGKMQLYLAGLHGSNANRITSAKALASYVLSKWNWLSWTLTAGLRYENVLLHKNDFTTADLRRSGHKRIEQDNHVQSLIPSLGVNYKFNSSLSAFAGVHKGFAPPSAGRNQKAESSINSELGLRYDKRELRFELIGFYNNYSNMLGSDLAAAGGTGTLEQFDVGAARVWGGEFLLSYQILPASSKLKMPIQLSYTYTDTEMLDDFKSESWGQVFVGDELPYIFRHALTAQVGLEYGAWDCNLSWRYNSDMRTQPGQGAIPLVERVPQHHVLDASMRYKLLKNLSLKLNAVNILGNKYLSSRHPSGLRVGHPRGIYFGINYSL